MAKAKVKGNAEARGVAMAVARFAELLDEAGRKEINHIATCIAAVCFLRTGAAAMMNQVPSEDDIVVPRC